MDIFRGTTIHLTIEVIDNFDKYENSIVIKFLKCSHLLQVLTKIFMGKKSMMSDIFFTNSRKISGYV